MVNLIIGGGNLKGLAFLGSLEYLHNNNLLSDLNNFYGCSIGAIIGVFYIIGYTPNEILQLMINTDFNNFWDLDLNNLEKNYSLLGFNLFNFIKLNFSKKENINITFKQFYEKYSININIISVSMSKREIIKLNHIDYPNLEVLTAIRASSSIPLIHPPVKINNDYFIDGCTKCLSGCLSDDSTDDNTYIIRLKQKPMKINNFYEYIYELFNTLTINNKDIYTKNTIELDFDDYLNHKYQYNDINNSDKIQFYYNGLKQAKEQIEI